MSIRSISRYQLLEPLEAGAGWSAFRANDEHGELVELRMLDANAAGTTELLRCWTLLSVVRHPGLRTIREVNADHEPPYCVLDAIVARTISDPLSIPPDDQFTSVVTRLLGGLAEAHRCGIVAGHIDTTLIAHRTAGDWLLDLSRGGPGLVSTARGRQESDFTAPEILRGDPCDAASDIYALCSLLQRWASVSTSMDCHAESTTSDRAGTSLHRLAAVIRSGLEPDPARRPTAAALLAAIRLTDSRALAPRESSATLALQTPMSDASAATLASTLAEPAVERTLTPDDDRVTDEVDAVPPQLGRFQLGKRIGSGAVGVVYRGVDTASGEAVAIKILNARLARNAVTLRRFSKEARMLARAGNPFVANLIDANEDAGLHFLAIEFVGGGTLSDAISTTNPLRAEIALRLILDVSRGLAVAHQQAIVHRDLKPDNILLTDTGRQFVAMAASGDSVALPDETVPLAKLSDFGLAREDQQSDSLAITQDGAILGTPLYMSPEQCRGQQSDLRSDIYALGATLFHLLAGRPPFQGENHIAVMNAHCQEPLPSLRQLCPDLSDGTIAVVEKCLAKNPDARYSDASALQQDVERLLHGEPASMVLHPATPSANGEMLEFPFTVDLTASPAQLWPYVSHTDRVNHALGLPTVTYTTRTDPERGVERFAEARIAGQKLAWQEHPYEWIEGRRLSVLREFSTGPFLWFMSIIDLQPSGSGTRLTQTLRVVPRNWIGRLLAKYELGRKSPKSFSRLYQQVDGYLSRGGVRDAGSDAFGSSTELSPAGRARLLSRIEQLQSGQLDPAVTETLKQFLEHASDPEVARIRPLVFAERFGLEAQQVINACLLGAKEGLLVLLWDILCPSCRIPADVQETLASLKDHAYCPSCDLKYEVDFANSVEMIFRAHPEVRAAETRTYCIGGPAFSAHVVAQVRLIPDERFEMELALTEGTYRVRGAQLPFAVDLRVSAGGGAGRFELPLNRPPLPGAVPTLRSGSQVLTLFNNTPRELQIRIERSAGRSMAVTAAAAAAMPLFREMFPDEVLAPGQIVSVTSITLLMIELCDARQKYRELGDGPAFGLIRSSLMAIDEQIRSSGGAVVKIVGEGIVATFADSDAALSASVQLLTRSTGTSEQLPLRMALHRGPALVTTINDRLDYFGETVHMAGQVLALASPDELLLTSSSCTRGSVANAIQGTPLICDTVPFMIPDSMAVLLRCRHRHSLAVDGST